MFLTSDAQDGYYLVTTVLTETFSFTFLLNIWVWWTILYLYSVCTNSVPEREECDHVNKTCALMAFPALGSVLSLASEQGTGGQSDSLTKRENAKDAWGNSGWDRGDPNQAVLRALSALHSSIHLSCHHPRTRALQASLDGQRKARINKEGPHHVMNSLLRHLPWQFHTGPFSTWHRG